jgi:hypothetical protein
LHDAEDITKKNLNQKKITARQFFLEANGAGRVNARACEGIHMACAMSF